MQAKLISTCSSLLFRVYLKVALKVSGLHARLRKNSVIVKFDEIVLIPVATESDRGIDNAIKNLLLDSLIKSRLFDRVRNYVLEVRRARALSPLCIRIFSRSRVLSSVSRPRPPLSPRVPLARLPFSVSFPGLAEGRCQVRQVLA